MKKIFLIIFLSIILAGCSGKDRLQFEKAESLLNKQEYTDALQEFENIIKDFPGSKIADKVKLRIEECKTKVLNLGNKYYAENKYLDAYNCYDIWLKYGQSEELQKKRDIAYEKRLLRGIAGFDLGDTYQIIKDKVAKRCTVKYDEASGKSYTNKNAYFYNLNKIEQDEISYEDSSNEFSFGDFNKDEEFIGASLEFKNKKVSYICATHNNRDIGSYGKEAKILKEMIPGCDSNTKASFYYNAFDGRDFLNDIMKEVFKKYGRCGDIGTEDKSKYNNYRDARITTFTWKDENTVIEWKVMIAGDMFKGLVWESDILLYEKYYLPDKKKEEKGKKQY